MYQDKIIPRSFFWVIVLLCTVSFCLGAIIGILGAEEVVSNHTTPLSAWMVSPLFGAIAVASLFFTILYEPKKKSIKSKLHLDDHARLLTRFPGQWVIFALPDGKGGLDRIFLNGERLYTPVDVRRLTVSAFSAPNGTSYADWEKENLP